MESTKFNALLIEPEDNVAVAIVDIQAGEKAMFRGGEIIASQKIPKGHKIARAEIKKGDEIVKYNHCIGIATEDIKPGEWVHSHNVEDISETLEDMTQKKAYERLKGVTEAPKGTYRKAPKLSRDHVMLYPRPWGPAGIRNNVLVISIIQCANLVAQKIADATGAHVITQEGGCLEFPDRLHALMEGFICAGIHPNTYGVLVVSLGCQQIKPDWIVDPIKKAGREVYHLCVQEDGGFHQVIAEGTKLVKQMQARALDLHRQSYPISELILTTHCGGSDWTSGLANNAVLGGVLDMHEAMGGTVITAVGRGNSIEACATGPKLEKMMEIGDRFREDCKIRNGKGMHEVNPTPGNKAGGLTTLEEKNLGTHQSDGKCMLQGILEVGERAKGPGKWGVDQCHGNNDSYGCTGKVMSGAHILMFSTGRGTFMGNACAPFVKCTSNQETYDKLKDIFDYCTAPVLRSEKTLEEACVALYELVLDVAEGKLTAAEELGEFSWTIPMGKSLNGDFAPVPPTCAVPE